MRKSYLLSNIIVLIFCLGMVLPYVNSGLSTTNIDELIITDGSANSGIPITDPIEIKANTPPTLYYPGNGAYINDATPTFDWSDVDGSDMYNIEVSRYSDCSSPYIDLNVATSYYASPTLGEGTWYWHVRTRQLLLFWGAFSEIKSFIVDTIPPSAPQLVFPPSSSITNDNTVPFDWYAVTGCNYYELQIDESPSFPSPNSYFTSNTAYTSPPLAEGPHYWRVRARDYALNWGYWSSVWLVVVDTIAPGVVTLVSPANGLNTPDATPTFIWNPVSGASSYHLQVSLYTSFSTRVIDVWVGGTSYTAPSPLPDAVYYWRVQARDAAYNVGPYSSYRSLIIDTIAPIPPTLLSPDSGIITADTMIYLDWSTVSDAYLYHLQVDDSPAFSSPIHNVDLGSSTTSYITQSLSDGIYYWRVMARDIAGNWGSYTTARSFIVDTTSPVISAPGVTPTIPDDDDYPIFHCTVTDQNGLSIVQVTYRIDGGDWNTVPMYWSFGDTYEYMFTVLPYGTCVEYYFRAYDKSIPANVAIANNGGSYYNFTVVSHDTTGPTIVGTHHTPTTPSELNLINFYANVTDESDINYVQLAFRINSGDWNYLPMLLDIDDRYAVTVGLLEIGDLVEYYVIAEDSSPVFNGEIDDNDGLFYSFTVETSDSTGPTITAIHHDPETPTEIDTITISCEVTDINDIQEVVLHYRVNSGSWITVNFISDTGDMFVVNIGSFAYGVVVDYFISSTDDHILHNEAFDDNFGLYYSFAIGSSDVTGPVISNVVYPLSPTDTTEIIISCDVIDPSDVLYVTLYYQVNLGPTIGINMTKGAGDSYSRSLGLLSYGDDLSFVIFAKDDSVIQNEAVDDNGGLGYNCSVSSSDVTGPVITNVIHNQEKSKVGVFNVTCTVTDINDVQSVIFYYRINNATWFTKVMTVFSGNMYNTSIGPFAYGDYINYYILATDNSPYHNTAIEDNSGIYFTIQMAESPKFSLYYLIPTLAIFSLAVLIRKRK